MKRNHLHSDQIVYRSGIHAAFAFFSRLILILCFLFEATGSVKAQPASQNETVTDTVSAEHSQLGAPGKSSTASYPGGDKEFIRYIIRNLLMPAYYHKKTDTTITVTFTIAESGKLTDFRTTEAPNPLKKEAIRVVKHSGRWIPAYRDGKPVASERQQRITFRIE